MGEKEGYVYSLWTGRFQCRKATIKQYPDDSKNRGFSYARFADGTCIVVHKSPLLVHNAIVWLEERYDVLATVILVEYQEQQISKLKEKIENHKNKIQILSGGIK